MTIMKTDVCLSLPRRQAGLSKTIPVFLLNVKTVIYILMSS